MAGGVVEKPALKKSRFQNNWSEPIVGKILTQLHSGYFVRMQGTTTLPT